MGKPTEAEQSLVSQFIADQKAEVTPSQITSLSKLMRRSKDTVVKMIETAREEFQSNAEFYVRAHKEAVESALGTTDRFGNPDSKALDAAMRGSQWAMENLAAEGQRIVEKVKSDGPSGPRIMVNIGIGAKNDKTLNPEEVEVIDVEEGVSSSLESESQ